MTSRSEGWLAINQVSAELMPDVDAAIRTWAASLDPPDVDDAAEQIAEQLAERGLELHRQLAPAGEVWRNSEVGMTLGSVVVLQGQLTVGEMDAAGDPDVEHARALYGSLRLAVVDPQVLGSDEHSRLPPHDEIPPARPLTPPADLPSFRDVLDHLRNRRFAYRRARGLPRNRCEARASYPPGRRPGGSTTLREVEPDWRDDDPPPADLNPAGRPRGGPAR